MCNDITTKFIKLNNITFVIHIIRVYSLSRIIEYTRYEFNRGMQLE